MSESVEELDAVSKSLRDLHSRGDDATVQDPLDRLESAASEVGQAWSGSSLGYHADVYYVDLKPPPPGAHFSQEWGFLGRFQGTTGDWREYPHDAVRDEIHRRAGNPDLSHAEALAREAARAVEEGRATIKSVFTGWLADSDDAFVRSLLGQVEDVVVLSSSTATKALVRSGSVMTRDSTALG